jgi:hypothetical protein
MGLEPPWSVSLPQDSLPSRLPSALRQWSRLALPCLGRAGLDGSLPRVRSFGSRAWWRALSASSASQTAHTADPGMVVRMLPVPLQNRGPASPLASARGCIAYPLANREQPRSTTCRRDGHTRRGRRAPLLGAPRHHTVSRSTRGGSTRGPECAPVGVVMGRRSGGDASAVLTWLGRGRSALSAQRSREKHEDPQRGRPS